MPSVWCTPTIHAFHTLVCVCVCVCVCARARVSAHFIGLVWAQRSGGLLGLSPRGALPSLLAGLRAALAPESDFVLCSLLYVATVCFIQVYFEVERKGSCVFVCAFTRAVLQQHMHTRPWPLQRTADNMWNHKWTLNIWTLNQEVTCAVVVSRPPVGEGPLQCTADNMWTLCQEVTLIGGLTFSCRRGPQAADQRCGGDCSDGPAWGATPWCVHVCMCVCVCV